MFKYCRIMMVAVLVSVMAFPTKGMAHRYHHRGSYSLTANTAVLWNPITNQRYFDLRADREVFPASTTKVLTALIVLENLPLDKIVTVSQHATDVPQTKLSLRAGETWRVRDLLYGLLLKSANDAAVVLAEAVAGSEGKFVDMMNAKAKALGALHTHFANPHGLPSAGPQYTTAADMALIFNQALKNDFFRQLIMTPYKVIYSTNGHRCFLKSHNKILFSHWKHRVFGKTGWTIEAQSCFVGYLPQGRNTLIVAVYGCHRRWTDIKYILERYGHVIL